MSFLNNIKQYAYLVAVAVTISVTSLTTYAEIARKPIHNVVLIHGIAGDHTTFQGMNQSLKVHLTKRNPKVKWNIYTYLYQTGREEKGSSYQFAKELNIFLDKHIKGSPEKLQPGDKISFIMHSQGGIVGGIWMYMSAVGRKGFEGEYLPYMDNYISIGTPFWGSRIAALSELNEAFGGLLGIKEAHDMHPLSNKSFDSKISVLNLVTQPELKEKIKHIQVINIAARAPLFNHDGLYLSSDLLTSDSDMAVEIPAANMNFLYGRFSGPVLSNRLTPSWVNIDADRESTYSGFKDIKFSDLYVVQGVHMSSKPEKKTSTTMVPDECITNLHCGHPTLLLLVNSLQRKQEHNDYIDREKNKAKTFYLIFNVRLPKFSIFDVDDVKLYEDIRGGESFEWNPQGQFPYRRHSKSHLRLPELYMYSGEQTGNVLINDVRIIKVGHFFKRPKNLDQINGFTTFTVSAPGLTPRFVKVPLRVDHTTFIDIDLN